MDFLIEDGRRCGKTFRRVCRAAIAISEGYNVQYVGSTRPHMGHARVILKQVLYAIDVKVVANDDRYWEFYDPLTNARIGSIRFYPSYASYRDSFAHGDLRGIDRTTIAEVYD